MTHENLAPDNQPSGITLPMFIGAAVVIIAAAMAAVWFAFPAPDTLHKLASPSGAKVIELGELCGETQCSRAAILDVTQPDGTHIRTGCPIDQTAATPLFAEASAVWSAAEDRVEIAYVADTGLTGRVVIETAACTQTE
ncbi:hypothetical protein [Devosia sp. SL43]|uniref:hypothetical protein n=1 Tax=Devosia sp. SL43 TaxID=2806348 RepID=UPI001F227E3D|nr:hypothetical protein [Devosia sp. SL43]UJW85675.1 hypothetical protein IM737_20205 [Devosia sp. SL43]